MTDEGLDKLRSSFIVVVGCGGVGSHAISALVRSGVSRIRIIDFDQVTLSSLNRHAVATLADVGTPKVQTIRKRLEQIAPWAKFDCRNELFGEAVAARQLGGWEGGSEKPSFVIDAIDNIDSKVALLHHCHKNGLKVISAMGAGCKSDPTRVMIGDISTSIEDPLAKSTRRRLRMLGINDGIAVVYSTEKPGPGKAQLQPLPEEEYKKGDVNQLGVLPDFRVRILPVLGTMPAVFGYAAANHVILHVTGYPYEYTPSKGRDRMYEEMLGKVQALEERLARTSGDDGVGIRIPVTKEDVSFLLEEVYKGKSAISSVPTRLALTRWEAPEEGYSPDKSVQGQKTSRARVAELVCMTKEEARRHYDEVLIGGKKVQEVYDIDTIARVEGRISEARGFEAYR